MNITEYTILSWSSVERMQSEVREHLAAGWQPLGGISGGDNGLVQAMVKHEEPPVPGAALARWQARMLEEMMNDQKGAARE